MNQFSTFEKEIKKGERFQFGKNWSSFLKGLSKEKIKLSKDCLLDFLETDNLNDLTFLDAGSGSGLSSLVARKSGAIVTSFDYDKQSVKCTRYLKNKYYSEDNNWVVKEGSALDAKFMESLGEFDIVYSWGVLHHTGDMYKALSIIDKNVKKGGKLYLALYNDQGKSSNHWKAIKRMYVKSPYFMKQVILFFCFLRLWGPTTIKDFLRLKPFYTWRNYNSSRGMSPRWDVIDWVGGYPFEVSKPEEIVHYYIKREYELIKLKTNRNGLGCNEFVFLKK